MEKEKDYVPLVVFQRIGNRASHSHLPSDNSNRLRPAEAAPKRAKKAYYPPMRSVSPKKKKKVGTHDD